MNWFKIGKGVCQGCILSPCLFNCYAEYIIRNVGLDEAQTVVKIAWRNINNLRYADDTTLMVGSEEELTSLLMRVKEYQFGERTRDCSPGHAGREGPHLEMTGGVSWVFSSCGASVGFLTRYDGEFR